MTFPPRNFLHLGKHVCFALIVSTTFLPAFALAQSKDSILEDFSSSPYFALALLSVIPLLFITTTSFVKISVVLAILKNALGTPQIPSATVISALAVILTLYVMAPVGQEIYQAIEQTVSQFDSKKQSNIETVFEVIQAAKEPFRKFLVNNSGKKEQNLFFELASSRQNPNIMTTEPTDFWVLYPAFLITELAEAFKMGFFLFLPFLILDLVISNILLALGMQMMNPSTISLPFKILLFVLVDGWYLLSKALVLNYA